MAEVEARCEGCQEPLTVAHVVERCAVFSDLRRMYLSPLFTLKNVLEEDCVIDLTSSLRDPNILNNLIMQYSCSNSILLNNVSIF